MCMYYVQYIHSETFQLFNMHGLTIVAMLLLNN